MSNDRLRNYQGRFGWALRGMSKGPQRTFDNDLFEFDEAAICPTVGAIIPAWLLVIPRYEAVCFRDIPISVRRNVEGIILRVQKSLAVFSGKVFMFEHGANQCGSDIGCGVDQAHAHLVCMNHNLVQLARDYDTCLHWKRINSFDPWAEIDNEREYYLVTDFDATYVSYPKTNQSQYFRKVIAKCSGVADEWDYRRFPYEQNAEITVQKIYFPNRRECAG